MSSERYFKNGEAKTMILDVLRTATEPINTISISKIMASKKSIDTDKDFDLERFSKVVLASLTRCESVELIERVGKDSLSILWQIKS